MFHATFPIRDMGDLQDSLDGVTAGLVVAFENDRGYELGGEYYASADVGHDRGNSVRRLTIC